MERGTESIYKIRRHINNGLLCSSKYTYVYIMYFLFQKIVLASKTRWDFRHQYTNSFKKYLRFHWLEKDSNLRTNHVEERKQSLLFVAQSLIRKKHISDSNFTFITLMTSNLVRKFTNPYKANQNCFLYSCLN